MGATGRRAADSLRRRLACAAAVLAAARAAAAPNLLRAGDFEGAEGRSFWHSNGGDVVDAARPGAAGSSVFRVRTAEPVWRMGRQKVGIPEGAKVMRLSGWARTEGVKPPPDVEWRRAQMQIGYHDAAGELIGKWNDIDLPLGDSAWAYYKSDFPVPAGARSVIVFLGNNNVSGTSAFDDVRLEALDADGRGLGEAPGEAKLVAIEVKPIEPTEPAAGLEPPPEPPPPEPEKAEAGKKPPSDEPAGPVRMSTVIQAAIGGGAVLVMMVVFALVARGRAQEPTRE